MIIRQPVPVHEAKAFGVMTVDAERRVVEFNEKPEQPQPMPGRDDVALVSMGIYVFDREFLRERLELDAEDANSAHDFGKNVIPESIEQFRVFAYPFEDVETRALVGVLQSHSFIPSTTAGARTIERAD